MTRKVQIHVYDYEAQEQLIYEAVTAYTDEKIKDLYTTHSDYEDIIVTSIETLEIYD